MEFGKLIVSPLARRQRKLALGRQSLTELDFVNQVSSNALGRAAASLLLRKLTERVFCEEFSPYPNDDLLLTYGLAEEDLDIDVVLDIIKTVKCPMPSREVLASIGPITTPHDIIRLIEASALADAADCGTRG